MPKSLMKYLAPCLAGLSMFALILPTAANAALEGNIGITSNYIWRGLTQTNDQSAVSGGLDYSHDSGLYLGTWASNVDFSDPAGSGAGEYELDIYGGFGGEAGGVGYDVGVITYQYPITEFEFTEVYVSASYSMVSVMYSFTDDFTGDGESASYLEGAVDLEVADGLGVSLHVGLSDGDSFETGSVDESYVDYSVSLSKDDFTFGISQTDVDGDNPRVFAAWSKGFDL